MFVGDDVVGMCVWEVFDGVGVVVCWGVGVIEWYLNFMICDGECVLFYLVVLEEMLGEEDVWVCE